MGGVLNLLLNPIKPMQLTMYLGNDLIEAVPVIPSELSRPGYLGKFKRYLKQRYFELIQETGTQPEFLVVNLGPGTTAEPEYFSTGSITR